MSTDPRAMTDAQIEDLRRATFSTDNPFCPVDAKSMRKAVRAAERVFLAEISRLTAELEEARKDAGQLEEQCEELTPAQKLLERVIKEDRHLLEWVEARSRRGGPTLRELIKKGAG